jgi:hypothetical protein
MKITGSKTKGTIKILSYMTTFGATTTAELWGYPYTLSRSEMREVPSQPLLLTFQG